MIPVYAEDEATQRLESLTVSLGERNTVIEGRVSEIINQIKAEGEAGLRAVATRLGDPTPEQFALSATEIEAAIASVPMETRKILEHAATNIRVFGQHAKQAAKSFRIDTLDCVTGLDWRPVERVACYVPGGRYPLPSTALMTAITAQTAGVPEIAILSPDLRPETVYAGHLAGVTKFFRLGGAQAVAAAAFGIGGMFRADMVVGPGNAYVTEAKRQLQGIIGIDMLAGPSEVAIIADSGANPDWLAIDLIAQAEHDAEARAYLLTDSAELARNTADAVERLLGENPDFAAHLQHSGLWGAAFVLPSIQACVEAVNKLAPEHLELMIADPHALKPQLKHYGALFMGYDTSVPVGDYLAGPNHTLPTARSARFSGTLNPMTFLRPQSWMERSPKAKDFMQDVVDFARIEGLLAHALSAEARI